MESIKVSRGLSTLRLCGAGSARAILLLFLTGGNAAAETCIAPLRPYLPDDRQAQLDNEGILRQDFELYIRDIQDYFRCLDRERARVFEEAREVSEEYGRFLETVDR